MFCFVLFFCSVLWVAWAGLWQVSPELTWADSCMMDFDGCRIQNGLTRVTDNRRCLLAGVPLILYEARVVAPQSQGRTPRWPGARQKHLLNLCFTFVDVTWPSPESVWEWAEMAFLDGRNGKESVVILIYNGNPLAAPTPCCLIKAFPFSTVNKP